AVQYRSTTMRRPRVTSQAARDDLFTDQPVSQSLNAMMRVRPISLAQEKKRSAISVQRSATAGAILAES
ncbi:MAG: hypothetical protein PHU85_18495, partial [Phycisphaerae bacterium]|nr:hypothetical protein [Phycisphaerae bacterium]